MDQRLDSVEITPRSPLLRNNEVEGGEPKVKSRLPWKKYPVYWYASLNALLSITMLVLIIVFVLIAVKNMFAFANGFAKTMAIAQAAQGLSAYSGKLAVLEGDTTPRMSDTYEIAPVRNFGKELIGMAMAFQGLYTKVVNNKADSYYENPEEVETILKGLATAVSTIASTAPVIAGLDARNLSKTATPIAYKIMNSTNQMRDLAEQLLDQFESDFAATPRGDSAAVLALARDVPVLVETLAKLVLFEFMAFPSRTQTSSQSKAGLPNPTLSLPSVLVYLNTSFYALKDGSSLLGVTLAGSNSAGVSSILGQMGVHHAKILKDVTVLAGLVLPIKFAAAETARSAISQLDDLYQLKMKDAIDVYKDTGKAKGETMENGSKTFFAVLLVVVLVQGIFVLVPMTIQFAAYHKDIRTIDEQRDQWERDSRLQTQWSISRILHDRQRSNQFGKFCKQEGGEEGQSLLSMWHTVDGLRHMTLADTKFRQIHDQFFSPSAKQPVGVSEGLHTRLSSFVADAKDGAEDHERSCMAKDLLAEAALEAEVALSVRYHRSFLRSDLFLLSLMQQPAETAGQSGSGVGGSYEPGAAGHHDLTPESPSQYNM